MDITADELVEIVSDLAVENTILRRRLAQRERQVAELTQALNGKAMEDTPPGGVVVFDQTTGRVTRLAPEDQPAEVREAGRLADQVPADGEPDGQAALSQAYRQSDQVLKMYALSPDMEVRSQALKELLGREPSAAELEDPERTLAGLYEQDHADEGQEQPQS